MQIELKKYSRWGALLVALLISVNTIAQTLDDVLRAIEANNTQLKAMREANAADVAELKADNMPGETSVEYSPFWQKGVTGTSSSELIVSQAFDFPSAYVSRNRHTELQRNVLDLKYQTLRRDILLEAKKICYDIFTALQIEKIVDERINSADSLLHIFEKRLQYGDATIIALNRIKMDRMAMNTEKVRVVGEIDAKVIALRRLNGGMDVLPLDAFRRISVDETIVPSMGKTLETSVAEASLDAASQEVKMAKQEWLPKLTVGYRRNTELRDASNGFLIGLSVPLFSTSAKTKSAKMRQAVAEMELENARVESDNRVQMLQNEVRQQSLALQTYDVKLMNETLSLLRKALIAGQLTIIEYYNESDRIYASLQERIILQGEYLKTLADLNR